MIFLDGYTDKSGNSELFSIVLEDVQVIEDLSEVVCFDVRKFLKFNILSDLEVYDIKMLYSHDGELSGLVRSSNIPSKGVYLELEKRFSAHTRAISEAKMDIESLPLIDLIPIDIRNEYMNARVRVIKELWELLKRDDVEHYKNIVWPVFKDIMFIEDCMIKIDVPYVDKMCKSVNLLKHEEKFFSHIKGLLKGGFVKTKISPVGSKTWRLRHVGGFNAMAIPHGAARKSIISRWDGGKILVVDFNAIDYRCIVEAVNDPELNNFIKHEKDFHNKTASLFGEVTPELRATTKKITYSHIYGSSLEGLQKSTLLPRDKLTEMLRILDVAFEPISRFRTNLSLIARSMGFVMSPAGHKVEIDRLDHDGKIIGLYAQTYSSYIFNKAVHACVEALKVRKSKFLFTVHDEMVFDIHPDELELCKLLPGLAEHVTGFVVKSNQGENYGECTD